MSDDLGRELKERLGRPILPAAPPSLRQEIETLRVTAPVAIARRRSARSPMVLLAAALVTVGLVTTAVGGALLRDRNDSRQDDLSVIPSATSSAGPRTTSSPSAFAAPIVWAPSSLGDDWPAPVRTEPAGRPILVPIPNPGGQQADPAGDTGSDAEPWGDISNVVLYGDGLDIDFVSGPTVDGVDPRQVWFGRGLVVDADGDGVADWRYGIDNVPVGTPSHCDGSRYTTRWWRTDLHTGRTDWQVCYHLVAPAPDGVPPAAPGSGTLIFRSATGIGTARARLFFSGNDTPAGASAAPLPNRFYAWASVIQDGRVVATDYAPNTGWIVASDNVKN